MNLNIKKDSESGEYYIDLYDLQDYFHDISIIEYYELEELEDGSISLRFFDKNNNVVSLKELS